MRIDALQTGTIILIKHMQHNINVFCARSVVYKKKEQIQRFFISTLVLTIVYLVFEFLE